MKRGILAATFAVLTVALGHSTSQAQAPCSEKDLRHVKLFYVKYLNRHPDFPAMQYWRSVLNSGKTIHDIEVQILSGDEYFYGNGGRYDTWFRGLFEDVVRIPYCPKAAKKWVCRAVELGCRKTVKCEFLEFYRLSPDRVVPPVGFSGPVVPPTPRPEPTTIYETPAHTLPHKSYPSYKPGYKKYAPVTKPPYQKFGPTYSEPPRVFPEPTSHQEDLLVPHGPVSSQPLPRKKGIQVQFRFPLRF